MRILSEIAEKVAEYEVAHQRAERLFNEVIKWLNDAGADGVSITSIFLAEEPNGEDQGDGEYCDQYSVGDSGDSFEGNYYHQIEESDKYIGYGYWC